MRKFWVIAVSFLFLVVTAGSVVAAVLHAGPSFAVKYGVAQYSNGQQISFGSSFVTTPVVITSAQVNGKAVSSCAANASPTGFTVYLHNDAGNPVSGAWVQWIAFIPDAGKGVRGGTMQANNMQSISFPAMSGGPVIVTNARSGSQAVNACAVNNANNGFTITIRDQANQPVQNATLIWMAVVPGAQNGFKGDVATRNNNSNVTCQAFDAGPAYVSSAQSGSVPMAAAPVNNRNNGFTLALTKHDGSPGSGWTQWLGYAQAPPRLYAVVVGGENAGNPHYDWYWGATSGMYNVLKTRYGCSDADITFLFCDTHSGDSRVDGVATKANVQAAFTTLRTKMKTGDKLFCYFVGHGVYTGGVSTYNTVGADMADSELNSWRQGLPAEQTYVFTQCFSGHFCAALARAGTVILTSTSKDETNSKAFAEPIRDAFNMVAGADANGDGKVSAGEAYNYALTNVKQQFGTSPVIEFCQAEDNGDGASSYGLLPTAGHGALALARFLK